MGESVRGRLAALSRREIAGLVALVVLVVGGAGLWYARSLPRGVEIHADGSGVQPGSEQGTSGSPPAGDSAGSPAADPSGTIGPSGTATPAPPPPSAPGVVLVHVAGEVRQPGVYELDGSARVIDAVEAAGGPTPKAFLEALNLASPVTDGQQILVPRRGPTGSMTPPVPVPSGVATTAPPTSTPVTGAPPTAGSGGLVNVNTAPVTELETLPGIGPVLAQSIVDHRTEHGPFLTVDALMDVSGIGPSTLEDIRDLVTV